jgi:hypothetical protein
VVTSFVAVSFHSHLPLLPLPLLPRLEKGELQPEQQVSKIELQHVTGSHLQRVSESEGQGIFRRLAVAQSEGQGISGSEGQRDFYAVASKTNTDKVIGDVKLCAGKTTKVGMCIDPGATNPSCRVWGHFYHTMYQKWLVMR